MALRLNLVAPTTKPIHGRGDIPGDQHSGRSFSVSRAFTFFRRETSRRLNTRARG